MPVPFVPRVDARVAARVLVATFGALFLLHATRTRADPWPDGDDDLVADHACDEAGYQEIGAEITDVGGGLRRTTLTVQVGDDDLDRFSIHRLALSGCPHHRRRDVLLLLPPLGSGFQNYEIGEGGDYSKSFAAFFASRGYDVWGYSPRTRGIPAGSCEGGALDCGAMAGWGIQTIVDDVSYIRDRIAHARPGARVAIGGLSLGSMGAIAAVNAHPRDYAGAFLLEGALHDASAEDQAITRQFCAALEGQLAQGISYDGQQLPGLKHVVDLAGTAPSAPSPLPGVPPGTTNHQAFLGIVSTPAVSPSSPRPGFFLLAGDPSQDRLTFADEALVRASMAAFDDYVTIRTLRDVDCSLAGELTFTGALDDYHGAVFVNAGGHGFGQAMLDTVALMSHARKTVSFVEPFGHIDHFFATNHRELTEQPILAWLERDVFDHPGPLDP